MFTVTIDISNNDLDRKSYFLELVTFPDGIIAWPGPLFLFVRTIKGIARIHLKHKA